MHCSFIKSEHVIILIVESLVLQQALLTERSKRVMAENRVGLGQSAAEAARAVERDYDEIITLLEAEVAHLRAQLLASPDDKDRQLIEYVILSPVQSP